MKDYFDFSKGRKNPYAAKIKEKGYSITIHYSPQDITGDCFDDTKDIIQALVELMSPDEAGRLLEHIRDNYELPCSDDVWDNIAYRKTADSVAEKPPAEYRRKK